MKNRREVLKMFPFLAAIPFVRISDKEPKKFWEGTTVPRSNPKPIQTYPAHDPQFLFPTPIREAHATPMGVVVQTEDGIYLICGGPDPNPVYAHLLCKAGYNDVKLQWRNDCVVFVQKRL